MNQFAIALSNDRTSEAGDFPDLMPVGDKIGDTTAVFTLQ
jgi:hypothetical protein